MSPVQERLADLMPTALAQSLPPRGPSLAARREALRRALTLRPWVSDRAIAGWCGVSRDLVHATRRKMTSAGEIRAWPDRVGRDGKRYTRFSVPKGPADEVSVMDRLRIAMEASAALDQYVREIAPNPEQA